MNVDGTHYRTIWLKEGDERTVQIIDQRNLPHEFIIEDLKTTKDVARAIKEMRVRGAGLIGATAAYGMYLAALESREELRWLIKQKDSAVPKEQFDSYCSSEFDIMMKNAGDVLIRTRPTAVNLEWAVNRQIEAMKGTGYDSKISTALKTAIEIADEDAEYCRSIGEHGVNLLEDISNRKGGKPVNILTHCNAGWLAFVDYGSATSPIYAAHNQGIDVHVWVDETRPSNQGARLTAWELGQHGVPHTVIADNAGGHLMQHEEVDIMIVGSDRTTYTGDVCNKIGTYLKAVAAKDNNIPFYVALPSSTIDWKMRDGVKEIPIEERGGEEVKYIQGLHDGNIKQVLLTPETSSVTNYSFDVTPSRLVTGIITERGICEASEDGILSMYPERRK